MSLSRSKADKITMQRVCSFKIENTAIILLNLTSFQTCLSFLRQDTHTGLL